MIDDIIGELLNTLIAIASLREVDSVDKDKITAMVTDIITILEDSEKC